MIIQHNLSALNAHRNLGQNNKNTAGQLEKLSSGYKVNRAADDAAGLAISEKMRGQIRGLGMAEQNATHAIDLIQTAEGGLNESHAVLQRMRELAVQASNGTYTDEDRQQITLEFEALKQEIDRIAESTNYNGIKLLNGNLGSMTVQGDPVAAAAPGFQVNLSNTPCDFDLSVLGLDTATGLFDTVTGTVTAMPIAQMQLWIDNGQIEVRVSPGTISFDSNNQLVYKNPGVSPVAVELTSKPVDMVKLKEMCLNYGCVDQSVTSLKIDLKSPGAVTKVDGLAQVPYNSSQTGFDSIGLSVTSGKTPGPEFGGDYSIEIVKTNNTYVVSVIPDQGTPYDYVTTLSELMSSGIVIGGVEFRVTNQDLFEDGMGDGKITVKNIQSKFVNHIDSPYILDFSGVDIQLESGIVFQIGANGGEDQRVWLSIANMSADAIGVWDGDTLTDGTINDRDASLFDARIDPIEEANFAIEIIHSATQQVSATRANLGAMQNRLEHALNNLGVTKENLTAAESIIRDTDMAAAMAEFTKNNIMVQASQAMLAQAQQLPQGVLQLLR